MANENTTLDTIYGGWKRHIDRLRSAIAPLTQGQLQLRAAPNERTVGEIAQHIVASRAWWFCDFLGERDDELAAMSKWDAEGVLQVRGSEITAGIDKTQLFMTDLLARWTPTDMQQTFPDDWDGVQMNLSRSWVVWHILEHDLAHSGEISLTLGMHGVTAPRI